MLPLSVWFGRKVFGHFFFVRKFIRPNIFVVKVLLLVEVNSIHLCNFERSRPVASIKTMEAVTWTKFS